MPTTTNDIAPVYDTGRFCPEFFGSSWRWAAMLLCGRAIVDTDMRHDKRAKRVHRTLIADTRGELMVTIPVAKPQTKAGERSKWRDVAISRHGEWWHIHRTTLESAYGRTPFFEFYIDRFAPFFSADTPDRYPSIVDLDIAADRLIADILMLPQPEFGSAPASAIDMSKVERLGSGISYYQVRDTKFGFIDGLSVLDLIFNLGPESALMVRQMARQLSDNIKSITHNG